MTMEGGAGINTMLEVSRSGENEGGITGALRISLEQWVAGPVSGIERGVQRWYNPKEHFLHCVIACIRTVEVDRLQSWILASGILSRALEVATRENVKRKTLNDHPCTVSAASIMLGFLLCCAKSMSKSC